MKTVIFGFIATIWSVSIFYGQSNNPYNNLGADVAQAFRVISADLEQGKINDIDQATLDYYFKNYFPGYSAIKLEEFTKILDILKDSDNKSIISNSGFSETAQGFLNKSLTSYSITALVDDVKKSEISENEMQAVLSVLAINYNLIKPISEKTTTRSTSKGPNADFELSAGKNLVSDTMPSLLPDSRKGTTAIWGAIGFITGFSICGLPCAFIGSAIGLTLGGYANGTGGGGSTGSGTWGPQP